MPGIFISYRREDSAGHAGRLYDRLSQHFGRSRVFMDVAQIEAGLDFVEAIEQAVGSCRVLLVMIGGSGSSADERGRRRLDDPTTSSAWRWRLRCRGTCVSSGAGGRGQIPAAQDLLTTWRAQPAAGGGAWDSRWDADVRT
jgi:hypothetical protein